MRSSSRKSDGGQIAGNLNPRPVTQLSVTFQGRQLYTYGVNLTVTCVLTAAKWEEWQTNAYAQLLQGYNTLQSQYEAELSQNQSNAETESAEREEAENVSSAMKRIIEQRELKRACMELVTRPFCRPLGKRLYTDSGNCDAYKVPQILTGDEFDDYGVQVRFLEQAFDWNTMSYLFYPYYWADRCDWGDLMRAQDEDPIFQAFKQAGMARVVVPVRPEYNEAVSFYMETGDIWLGGGLVAETEDEHALSIALDLQTVESVVEGEWETRVPTTLAIVQNKSARLDQEGLPCCSDVETAEQTSSISSATNVLQIIQP